MGFVHPINPLSRTTLLGNLVSFIQRRAGHVYSEAFLCLQRAMQLVGRAGKEKIFKACGTTANDARAHLF
jgi:hypothetical protein